MWTRHDSRACFVGGLFISLLVMAAPAGAQEKMDQIDVESIDAILSEETREGRARVMSAHPDLISRDGVFAVLKRGEEAVNAGEHDLAMRACDAADEIADRAGLDDFTAGVCSLMRGALLGHVSRHKDAIKALEAARPLIKQRENPAIESILLRELAERYESLGQVDRTKATYEEALELARSYGKARHLEADILGRLGSFERRRGNLKAAKEMFDQALAVARETGREPLEAALLLKIGFSLDDKGETDQALKHHERALEIYKRTNNRAGTISALNASAIAAKNLGRFREAVRLYEEALTRAEAIRLEAMIAPLKDNLGTVLRMMGRWDEGVQLHGEALAIYVRLEQPAGKQLVLNHLGIAHRVKGDPRTAMNLFRQSLKMARSLRAPAEESTVLINLGNAHRDIHQFEDAIRCYRKSLDIQERLGNPRATAAAQMNLADVYRQLTRRDLEKRYLAQARDNARGAGDALTEASALRSLASIEAEEGDQTHALAMAEDALRILPEDSSERCRGLLDLAKHRLALGEPDVALSYAEEAAKAAEEASRPRIQALALMLSACTQLPRRRTSAVPFLLDMKDTPGRQATADHVDPAGALERLSEVRPVVEYLDDWQLIWLTHWFRGSAYAEMGDHGRKLACYLEAAEAIERQQNFGWTPSGREWFAERPVYLYREIAIEYLRQGRTRDAFHYAEMAKAQIMLESMTARPLALTTTGQPTDLGDRQQGALKRLGELDAILRRERSHPEQRRDIELINETLGRREEVEDELRQIKGALQRQHPAYAYLKYPDPPQLEAACALLAPNTALVEYIVGLDFTAAVVLSREGASTCLLEATPLDLRGHVQSLQEAVGTAVRSADTPASRLETIRLAQQVYQAAFEPVRRLLPARIDRLIVVPDGPLHSVPFAALVSAPQSESREPPRYLCEEYCLSYAPSATVLHELRVRRQTLPAPDQVQIVAVCDPAYAPAGDNPEAYLPGEVARRSASSWNRLTASAREGAEIQALWGDRVALLSQAEATEDRIKLAADGATCLHFATHAYLDSTSPLYSAIVLTPGRDQNAGNGYLQAYEVCEMELKGSLVVLSACDTASGKLSEGEGLMGLSRAFFLSGAKAVVATLWQVDDGATSVLGAELHRRLKEGRSVGEALREAQVAMLGRYDQGTGQLRGPGRTRLRESVPADREPASKSHLTEGLSPFYWAAFGVYGDPDALLTTGSD